MSGQVGGKSNGIVESELREDNEQQLSVPSDRSALTRRDYNVPVQKRSVSIGVISADCTDLVNVLSALAAIKPVFGMSVS